MQDKAKRHSGPTDYIGNIARITGDTITYLHKDHLGSASSGTDASGEVDWTERYTPFGEQLLPVKP